jgi:Tol biopolymer transport system component
VAVSLNRDIWIYDITRQTLSRLTFGGTAQSPLWTPDGKRVTFSSWSGGTSKVFWKAANGSGPEELLTENLGGIEASSWSPDGHVLGLIADIFPGGWDIWLLPFRGERTPKPFLQTHFRHGTAVFSPDGHWLAYTSDESGRFEVYVQPLPEPGGKWQVSTEGGDQPLWARNGRELFYREENKMMAVEVRTRPTFSTGARTLLFTGQYVHHSPSPPADYDITPDGRQFLMVQPGAQGPSAQQINVVLNWFEELKRRVGPEGK